MMSMMSAMMSDKANDVGNGVGYDVGNDVGNGVRVTKNGIARCDTIFVIIHSKNVYLILSMMEYMCSLEFARTR